MFGQRYTLLTIGGFKIRVDLSWIFLAALVTWSLAAGTFPIEFPRLPARVHWLMGLAGAIGLFASIIFHELSHAFIARRHGIPIDGITLFMFGGVAEMTEELNSPKAELRVALAGPLASIFLAMVFWGFAVLAEVAGASRPVLGILDYLSGINLILAIFNLIPAFPMDGGRVLRAALWARTKDLRRATRIASSIGAGFGYAFIALGFIAVLEGYFIGGLWWALIGLFLRGASEMSYVQLLTRNALHGEPVRRFMQPNVTVAPPNMTVEDFVDRYLFQAGHKLYPVAKDGELIGCLTVEQIRELPREEWSRHTVAEVARRCDRDNTIDPDADALDALARMSKTGASRLMVTREGHLFGMIALRDLLRFLDMKIELEPNLGGRRPRPA